MNVEYHYCIEGENVTVRQIAERIGVATAIAHARMKVAQKMEGPVTWLRLREVSTYARKGRARHLAPSRWANT